MLKPDDRKLRGLLETLIANVRSLVINQDQLNKKIDTLIQLGETAKTKVESRIIDVATAKVDQPKSTQPSEPECQIGSPPTHEERLSCYQILDLRTQWAMLIVTILAFLAAAYYACTAKKQTVIAQHQLEQMIDGERPWLSIDDSAKTGIQVIHQASRKGSTVGIDLRYLIKNTGKSPANILIYGEIVPLDHDDDKDHYLRHTKKACDDARSFGATHPSDWQFTVLPSSPMIYDVGYQKGNAGDDFRPPIELPDNYSDSELFPVNYACMIYRSANGTDDKIHQTPFIGILSMVKDEKRTPLPDKPIGIVFHNQASIPGNKLCVVHVLTVGRAD